ncbi:hypothetical protein ACFVHB_20210 [Kitasatospora sp. NPDC127111]|uniref:hypothetical protein n=1 Tax=Kitasatospora sp. NPDC127111 TaxID=3345363 RepID=UPI00364186E0
MAEINLTKKSINDTDISALTVETSVYEKSAAFISLWDESAHMTRSETRQLRDELNRILGEKEPPAQSATSVKVGDRVTVISNNPGDGEGHIGEVGALERIDADDEELPYKVRLDGDGDTWWCRDIRRVDEPAEAEAADQCPDTASHFETFRRRYDAAAKAREVLGASAAGPFGIRSAVDPESVIRLADWLLGEAA